MIQKLTSTDATIARALLTHPNLIGTELLTNLIGRFGTLVAVDEFTNNDMLSDRFIDALNDDQGNDGLGDLIMFGDVAGVGSDEATNEVTINWTINNEEE